jgi:hypothetical protein
MSATDRIEKDVLTDVEEFGQWFGVRLDQPFAEGRTITGTFDADIDEEQVVQHQRALGLQPSGVRMPAANTVFCTVERLDPERCFSFRWIPYGIDAECDPANEPTTLVEFRLEPVPGGTRLVIVESGFEAVPPHRRERAFRMNEGGWSAQADNIRRHVERA